MSRKYKGLVALTSKGQEGSMENLISTVSKEIEAAGGKVENVEDLGRKDFANAPRKITGGHFVSYTVSGEADLISKIDEVLALNLSVYLNQFNRVA